MCNPILVHFQITSAVYESMAMSMSLWLCLRMLYLPNGYVQRKHLLLNLWKWISWDTSFSSPVSATNIYIYMNWGSLLTASTLLSDFQISSVWTWYTIGRCSFKETATGCIKDKAACHKIPQESGGVAVEPEIFLRWKVAGIYAYRTNSLT